MVYWHGKQLIDKQWNFLWWTMKFSLRSKDGMGRFGGGWNWKLGIQAGGSTMIFSLLVCELRIDRKKVEVKSETR